MTEPAVPDGRSLPPRLLLVAGLLTVALGAWGFERNDPDETVLAHVYRSLQLFVLETGDVAGRLPWQLEVARYAAAAIVATSIVLAVVAVSRDRIDRWRAGRSRGHVIVCGLGRRGLLAALRLHDAGERVVAVEVDRGRLGVRRCRHARVPVVLGDAGDPHVLRQAGVAHAAHLIVLVSDLDVAAETVLGAIDTVANRRDGELVVHLEVDDPHLATLLRAASLSSQHEPTWRLDELDLAGAGATVMVDELAPWPSDARSAHVLVVGRTALAMAVVRELGRRWQRHVDIDIPCDPRSVLDVTVLAPHAGCSAAMPSVDQARIEYAATVDRDVLGGITAAYVCPEDETAALTTALELTGRRPGLPTLVHVERAASLATLLRRTTPSLHWISVEDRTLTPATLLSSTEERIARALHEFYRRTMARPDDVSAALWDQLPSDLRASNLAQAAHIATKLAAIGCSIVPDDGTPPDRLSAAEIELLGGLEHERWVHERSAAGWSPGPRDPVARTSPDLVPWADLDDAVREIDRSFVAALPDILADAGLRLSRIDGRGFPDVDRSSDPRRRSGPDADIRHWAPGLRRGSLESRSGARPGPGGRWMS